MQVKGPGNRPQLLIVGAPVEEGGIPLISRAIVSTKKVKLTRVFEYNPAEIRDEYEASEHIIAKYARKSKRKRKRRGKKVVNIDEIDDDIDIDDDDDDVHLKHINYEEEEYIIQPLYSIEGEKEGEEGGEEGEEIAVFCQPEHQKTGMPSVHVVRRNESWKPAQAEVPDYYIEGGEKRLGKKDRTPIERNKKARVECDAVRLDCIIDPLRGDGDDDNNYAHLQTLEDLELDHTAHLHYSNNPRLMEEGPVNREKYVYNAFHQVSGRPNVYAFGSFGGKGFDGCGVKDSWSHPNLILRRDMHVQSWEDGSYDYVIQTPRCTPAHRKKQLRHSRAKASHAIKSVNTSRKDARLKLQCLTAQFKEFCGEPAFMERCIGSDRVVIWQGDPKPRVVFLFKAVTKTIASTALYDLSNKCSGNHLGILQTELGNALRERIKSCYFHSHGEDIPWEQMEEFIKAMVPMCCRDTQSVEKRVDTNKGGVAILYAVPVYDPTGWGQ